MSFCPQFSSRIHRARCAIPSILRTGNPYFLLADNVLVAKVQAKKSCGKWFITQPLTRQISDMISWPLRGSLRACRICHAAFWLSLSRAPAYSYLATTPREHRCFLLVGLGSPLRISIVDFSHLSGTGSAVLLYEVGSLSIPTCRGSGAEDEFLRANLLVGCVYCLMNGKKIRITVNTRSVCQHSPSRGRHFIVICPPYPQIGDLYGRRKTLLFILCCCQPDLVKCEVEPFLSVTWNPAKRGVRGSGVLGVSCEILRPTK